jgi:hypothetical protein
MLYFEWGAAQPTLRDAQRLATYEAWWFDPRTGAWIEAGELESDAWREIALPPLPSEEDWALKLKLQS